MLTLIAKPARTLQGELRVPGDKSISHRAIILGAIAEGVTEVRGFLEGEDTLATLSAFKAMGVAIEHPAYGQVCIQGVGLYGLKPATGPLDLGNSGTSMRLMAGLLSGQAFTSELIGDASLSKRPMRRVIDPLSKMGARIDCTPNGTAPLHIHHCQRLQGIDYAMPVASAQVKSCLLLAGLYAEGRTCVREPGPSRDHTERMLQGFGYMVETGTDWCALQGGGKLYGKTIQIPADLSSAAFFLVGAAIAETTNVRLSGVGINPTRTGIIAILQRMGAEITILNEREEGGEPVADLEVRSSQLQGIAIPPELVPLAIDEFPAICIAAACAKGRTVISGAKELRFKESDRIETMAQGLKTLGVQVTTTEDGMIIDGGTIQGGTIDSHGDHRIAMSFTMASLRAMAPITIIDCVNINTSFPEFTVLARQAGLVIEVREE